MTENSDLKPTNHLLTTDIPTTDSDTISRQMSVLVVDDEPPAADLTATYLERESSDFDVIQETSPEDGLAHLDIVDAIVSDYDMPRMDGLEFLEEVRAKRQELPFILFTGRGNEEIASEAISKGVHERCNPRPTPLTRRRRGLGRSHDRGRRAEWRRTFALFRGGSERLRAWRESRSHPSAGQQG